MNLIIIFEQFIQFGPCQPDPVVRGYKFNSWAATLIDVHALRLSVFSKIHQLLTAITNVRSSNHSVLDKCHQRGS